MARVVLYHNPACSKSRGAKQILTERGIDFDTVEYLKTPLDEAELRRILETIDDPPAELVRKDANFRELGLSAANYVTADAVVALLLEHPRLMQRPVVLRGDQGVIGRPSEKVEDLI
ncbi:MAG: arsenate reductase (glutaredoxin) [Gammaproteobacteria bacterium]|nr:arsenate reductase (glutaredoxin) [Gammaproteobacteria bacterium]